MLGDLPTLDTLHLVKVASAAAGPIASVEVLLMKVSMALFMISRKPSTAVIA